MMVSVTEPSSAQDQEMSDSVVRPGTPRSFYRAVLRVIVLLAELYLLLVFINVALLAPFPYDQYRILFVVIAACTSGLCAYAASLLSLSGHKKLTWKINPLSASILLWLLVVVTVCLVMLRAVISR